MQNPNKVSITLLRKIMPTLVDKSPIIRTSLAQAAQIHYSRLSEQFEWLEQKQYIKFEVNDGKVVIALTEKGRGFAVKLLTLEE